MRPDPLHVAEICQLADDGLSNTQIHRKTGYARNTVIRWANKRRQEACASMAEEKSLIPATEDAKATPVDPVQQAMDRLAHQRDLKQEHELLKAVAGERSMRNFLESIIRDVAPQFEAIPPYERPTVDAETSRESLILLWSDWHAFEEVKAVRTLGFNEYTGPVMSERARRITNAAISIKTRLERGQGWLFDDAHLCLNGDFVSGTIHEVERHSDAANVVHACFATATVIAAAIRDLAPNFKKMFIRGTCGNHGRFPDARKMQQKDPTRNWDYVIYLFAMQATSNIPNVTWDLPDSYFSCFDVEDFRFLQHHGHDIKSWNSLPHYGLDRYSRNMNSLFGKRRERIDYYLISHFHNQTSTSNAAGETFLNGSLIGGTEYSVAGLGRADDPKQWMFQVEKQHGVNARWPLAGDGIKPVDGYSLPPWPPTGAD
jgi:hypothetical protein